jgi:hypothetical protein
MTGPADRSHNGQDAYERPTLGWRCGRAAGWAMPCRHGPTAEGACGGATSCKPARVGDSWQCRRPQSEGGPCHSGPGKDGGCGLSRPPCVPRRTLAVWRVRLSALVGAATVALIVLLAHGKNLTTAIPSSLNPGPLSAAHAHFASALSCATCHEAMGGGATAWWQAFWTPATLSPGAGPQVSKDQVSKDPAHRLSNACITCHTFGGHELQAHNQVFVGSDKAEATDCLMCHTEHKGRFTPVTTLSEARCQTCHSHKIKDFAIDHPAFNANFPYEHPRAIAFDHASHVAKHFLEPQVADRAPKNGCIGCHVVGNGGRVIQLANFQTMCATCHADDMAKRDFVFFRWPEIDNNTITQEEVRTSCLPAGAQQSSAAPNASNKDFSGVSADPLNALSAYVLDVPADSAADYEQPVQALARAMMQDGADALIATTRDRLNDAPIDRLFSGLSTEQVRQAACAWAANQEYTAPGSPALAGWRADSLSLNYTRPSHADPVIRSWIEAVVAQPVPADGDAKARLQAARTELLSASDGPGQCMKCHTLSGSADGPQTVNWHIELRGATPLTRFDHLPHLDLLGPQKTCTSCHALADQAAPSGGGLKPITPRTCGQCHAAGMVRDDCRTCHVYHQDHGFSKAMMKDAM